MKTLVTLIIGAIGGVFILGIQMGYESKKKNGIWIVDCNKGVRFVKRM